MGLICQFVIWAVLTRSQSKLNKLLRQFAASRWWPNRARGRRKRCRVDPTAPPTSTARVRACSTGASLTKASSLTDAPQVRTLLYIVDKPLLVMTHWTDSGENGKCSRLETVSAPLQHSATASFLLFLLFFSTQDSEVGDFFLSCTSRRDGVRLTGRRRNIIQLASH